MDPCPFVRILIGNFAITSPAGSKPSFPGEAHPSSSPYFCRIQLRDFDSHQHHHLATVPIVSPNTENYPPSVAAIFDLSKLQMEKLKATKSPVMKISVYKSRQTPSCAFDTAKLLGKISVPLDLTMAEFRACMFQNGWVALDGKNRASSSGQLLHVTVRAEPDPRFVFRFDGEPECSPQVFQIQGSMKQPVFTCKFSFRDRSVSSRSSISEPSNSKTWLPSLTSQKDHSAERKGWSITVHDLSGSPVAAASMVTPFVPSPGSHLVSRFNPGAWLILRPGGNGTWKPWGRLEAWRENNSPNAVGYRFEILRAVASPVMLASSTISSRHGGKLIIDVTSGVTPMNSPNGSWDLGSGSRSGSGSGSELGLDQELLYRGFVMSATVGGEGKCSKPEVEVGVQLVSCTEDAAAFVALAAAMDLCMDACKLFSQKLRKELRQ
ncbi:uncharacterized protein LOC129286864 [Prosopis cineraria]|uniref:uncharacterized protein LOC129286864 n=1 Tax=Prosopis cineraria TaxID=364024 RepID=UPI00240F7994|nr:uncharacterized protein LOC129286864 [Prosopis cineraria]